MHNQKECTNKTKGDQYLYGSFIKDGTDIQVKSIARFEGFECRIWSPEFHGIMLDSAITHAREAELLRKKLKYIVGATNKVKELLEDDLNTENSFRSIQHSLNSIVMSIACLEAWANRIIQSELKGSLKFERFTDGTIKTVEWKASRIEKDADLLEKVFIVIPLIFGIQPIKEHATIRVRLKEIISDRNALVHMKSNPKVKGQIETRTTLALKLLRRNSLLVVNNVIAPIKMIFEKSNREIPVWLLENISYLIATEKQVKKI